MRSAAAALIATIAIAGCGGGADEPRVVAESPDSGRTAGDSGPSGETSAGASSQAGQGITTGGSQYGEILFNTREQAIYIFENDLPGKSNCYGQCAKDWPPVFTEGRPIARGGVKQSLLGTTKRRDGRKQVTYRDQPLYYYVDEGPGEVKCHNVFLNDGLWWVLGPDGKRKA